VQRVGRIERIIPDPVLHKGPNYRPIAGASERHGVAREIGRNEAPCPAPLSIHATGV
jgi:hypothetical protein